MIVAKLAYFWKNVDTTECCLELDTAGQRAINQHVGTAGRDDTGPLMVAHVLHHQGRHKAHLGVKPHGV